MSSRMLSWKKGQKSPSMGNLEVFLFHFGMTFYFGISLRMEILSLPIQVSCDSAVTHP